MSIEQMRYAVANAYPGARWAEQVSKMADKKVHVIYMRLMNAGKLSANPNSYAKYGKHKSNV